MGKLKVFEITFDNGNGVFFAGDMVQGTVKLELSEPMKMREIRLTCNGKAFVRWSVIENIGYRRGGRHRKEAVEHTAEEDYFKYRFLLWGKGPTAEGEEGDNPDSNSLSAGVHTFQFECQLPEYVPSSFEGDHGYIRYWLKATVVKPWKFDHHTKQAFTVITNLDLNTEPKALEPINRHGQLSTGYWCFSKGALNIRFCTNCGGCVPGEVLQLYTEVENQDRHVSCTVEIRLKMLITYTSSAGKTFQSRKCITGLKREIGSGSNDWSDILKIPSLPPSHLNGCKYIDAKYMLQFTAETRGCNCKYMEFEEEIIIGTVPLDPGCLPTQPPPYSQLDPHALQTESDAALASNPVPSPLRRTSTPPSYEASVFGRVSIKDEEDTEYTRGSLIFAPMYTYYSQE